MLLPPINFQRKKKAQQAKQASRVRGARRFDYPKRKLELEEAKEL